MKKVDIMAGFKGGSGKTTSCVYMAQAASAAGRKLICLDLDPTAKSFSSYPGLEVRKLKVTAADSDGIEEIHEWLHAAVYEELQRIGESGEEGDVLIDTGSTNFMALVAWLLNSDAPETFPALGWDLRLNTVIGGGGDFGTGLRTLKGLADNFPTLPIVVWLNPHHGKLEAANGKTFEQTKIYADIKGQIERVITLPAWKEGTRPIVTRMHTARATFDEALTSPDLPLWERPRLRHAQRAIHNAVRAGEWR